MHDTIDFDEIISQYRADPYDYVDVRAPHTGLISFKVASDDPVDGPRGEWSHIPGTILYELDRERNVKAISSSTNGVVSSINTDADGKFVDAGETILTIKHPLKKREIIDNILKKVLFIFTAPERAKYFFALDLQSRIEKFGQRSVSIKPGDEVLTMSLMKRDTPVYFEGEPGLIHSIYFKPGDSVDFGLPLIGICPTEKLPLIDKIITRVKSEWEGDGPLT